MFLNEDKDKFDKSDTDYLSVKLGLLHQPQLECQHHQHQPWLSFDQSANHVHHVHRNPSLLVYFLSRETTCTLLSHNQHKMKAYHILCHLVPVIWEQFGQTVASDGLTSLMHCIPIRHATLRLNTLSWKASCLYLYSINSDKSSENKFKKYSWITRFLLSHSHRLNFDISAIKNLTCVVLLSTWT